MDSMQRFQESCRKSEDYPCNLIHTDHYFPYELEQYKAALNNPDRGYFSSSLRRKDIRFWSLRDTTAAFEERDKVDRVEGQSLATLLSDTRPDAISEFVFIYSNTSRSSLRCSLQQLKQILTHRQVMAPILDFVFTFRERGEPETLTALRSEDWLCGPNSFVENAQLGRSGLRIQHCFNLIGVEEDKTQVEWPWPLRQNAAYHSLDVFNGTSFWMSLKGNDEVSKRIQKSISTHPQLHPSVLTTPTTRFTASLFIHLIMFQWCGESWPGYIGFMKERAKEQLDKVRHAPVVEMTEPDKIEEVAALRRGNTMNSAVGASPPPRRGTLRKTTSFQTPELVKRMSERIMPILKKAQDPQTEDTKKDLNLDFDQLYSFEELQKIWQLRDMMKQSVLVIGQNVNVISQILARYKSLLASPDFTKHIDLQACQPSVDTFFSRSQQLVRGMESNAHRLENILASLDSAKNEFQAILEYRNIKTSEYFAQSAHDSTKFMELIAVKTKKETVSMHSITFLTLVFLPGTFLSVSLFIWRVSAQMTTPTSIFSPQITLLVASLFLTSSAFVQTVFSSGILRWNENGEDWTTNLGGLRLFLKICLPMTATTVGVWMFLNWRSKRRQDKDVWQLIETGMSIPSEERSIDATLTR